MTQEPSQEILATLRDLSAFLAEPDIQAGKVVARFGEVLPSIRPNVMKGKPHDAAIRGMTVTHQEGKPQTVLLVLEEDVELTLGALRGLFGDYRAATTFSPEEPPQEFRLTAPDATVSLTLTAMLRDTSATATDDTTTSALLFGRSIAPNS